MVASALMIISPILKLICHQLKSFVRFSDFRRRKQKRIFLQKSGISNVLGITPPHIPMMGWGLSYFFVWGWLRLWNCVFFLKNHELLQNLNITKFKNQDSFKTSSAIFLLFDFFHDFAINPDEVLNLMKKFVLIFGQAVLFYTDQEDSDLNTKSQTKIPYQIASDFVGQG